MTTQTLRPNGTNVSAGTVTGAASAHAALSDDSTGSYVVLAPDDYLELAMETFTVPAGAAIKAVRLEVDGGADSGSASGQAGIYVYPPSGNSTTSWFGTAFPYSGNELFTEASFTDATWTTAQQNYVDGVRVGLKAGQYSYESIRMIEATLSVIYVQRPTLTVDAFAADPHTDSSTIDIAWTIASTDSEGGPISEYEITVTDDNDSDAVVYYSGGVSYSGVDAAQASGLVSGDYTVKVRIGQTVNGSINWSDYATRTLNVDLDAAEISTVVGTADNATASISVAVTRDGTSEAWELVEVQRSVAGRSWAAVRGASIVDASGDANSFTVVDYEAPNGGSVVYRARAYLDDVLTGYPIVGDWTESAAVSWASDDGWLKVPGTPSKNVVVVGRNFGGESRDTAAGVFRPVNSAEYVSVTSKLSDPEGSITLTTTGSTGLADVIDALDSDQVLVLDMGAESLLGPNYDGYQYIAVKSVSVTWVTQYYLGNDEERRAVTVGYVSAVAPADPHAGEA